MRPEQFALWLHGYSTAKPEILDEKTREALSEVISGLVANKLAGLVGMNERGRILDGAAKEASFPEYAPRWAAPAAGTPLSPGHITVSGGSA